MHTYGNSNIWSFGTNSEFVTKEWKEAVFSEGAKNMSVYHKFLHSINWWDFAPDQSVIAEGNGTGDSLIVAMSSEKTNQIMVYFSRQSDVSLNLNKIENSTNFQGEWINPKTGARINTRNLSNNGAIKIKTPNEWDDALLLIGAIR